MRRHGPHQSATKSTSTGRSDADTSAANSLCAMNFTAAQHRTLARATQQRAGAGWAGDRRSVVAGRRGPPRARESGERGAGARVEAAVLGAHAMRTMMSMSGKERRGIFWKAPMARRPASHQISSHNDTTVFSAQVRKYHRQREGEREIRLEALTAPAPGPPLQVFHCARGKEWFLQEKNILDAAMEVILEKQNKMTCWFTLNYRLPVSQTLVI
jgi:hypothetical protein